MTMLVRFQPQALVRLAPGGGGRFFLPPYSRPHHPFPAWVRSKGKTVILVKFNGPQLPVAGDEETESRTLTHPGRGLMGRDPGPFKL